ncbi:MAG: tetratricopeptide repeat protein [Magnetospirillum sp. WYHS-4]
MARKKTAKPDVEALFAKAVIALHKGKVDYAEPVLAQVLELNPDHADSLHVMGFIAFRRGEVDESARLIGRAVALQPDNPAFLGNYGAVLNEMGLWDQAESACRKAVDLAPGYPDGLNNLAIALTEQGRLDEAEDVCAEAIESRPDFAPARISLGNLYRRQGRREEAVAAYEEAVHLRPGDALALGSLGAALRELGRLEEAESACRRAVELAPHAAEALVVLGTVLLAKGDGDEALAVFQQAVHLNPGHAEARLDLAAALYRLGRVDEAIAAYREAGAISAAAARASDGMGVALLAAGRLAEARYAFREALDLDPNLAGTWYNLASAGEPLTEADAGAMAALLGKADLAPAGRAALHFALGDLRDREGKPGEAFAHWRSGNDLRRRDFDADDFDARIEAIMAAFPAASFAAWKKGEGDSERPVFVVGMPRSGTSLVEQILASHPEIFGAGELDAIGSLEPGDAAAYLRRLQAMAPWAARVVDKTPANFLHLGAIARMFPGARVIHCLRDPRDVLLSCYQQNFAVGHAWTTSLEGIARYQAAHDRLMHHWRRALPLPLLEVSYEALVADPEAWSRRLIDFLGLSWHEACLRFFETKRPVLTASAAQVRRPVYASSVGRWKVYADLLGCS